MKADTPNRLCMIYKVSVELHQMVIDGQSVNSDGQMEVKKFGTENALETVLQEG